MSAMQGVGYVARVWGWVYTTRGEKRVKCWLTPNGSVTEDARYAQIYPTEAEAWEHMRTTDNMDGTVEKAEPKP